jgi:hypothetical protein
MKCINQKRIFGAIVKLRNKLSELGDKDRACHQSRQTTYFRRINKVLEIQEKYDISGLVWEEVNSNEEGLFFPVFSLELKTTPSDMVVMKKWKTAVIKYAVGLAIDKKMRFFRVNLEKEFVEITDLNFIWTFAAYFDWAIVTILSEPCEIHLLLGKGDRRFLDNSMYIHAETIIR